jgi:hypothetical protein
MASNKKKIEDMEAKLDVAKMYFQNEFLARWNRRTPVDTGRLQAGNEVQVGDTEFTFHNEVPYFPYIEHGTETHRPVKMLGVTTLESPAIWAYAAKKAKL